jgi:hypothetical protein
LSVVEGEKL